MKFVFNICLNIIMVYFKETTMTKIAIWCRHKNDNIIGIGPNIPWHIPSDFKRFRRITEKSCITCGQTTYESFPNRTLPNRKIYVLSFDEKYEVSDKNNHFVINNPEKLCDVKEPLYICGGASIYKMFMQNDAPDVIVDSCYMGDINSELKGNPVDITLCIDVMNKDYKKVSPDYNEDNVITTVWVKKGAEVNNEILNHITLSIINK